MRRHSPEETSQMRTARFLSTPCAILKSEKRLVREPSRPYIGKYLSNPCADAKYLPSGDQATRSTVPLCPSKVDLSLPVVVSHSRTVESLATEASILPSGD